MSEVVYVLVAGYKDVVDYVGSGAISRELSVIYAALSKGFWSRWRNLTLVFVFRTEELQSAASEGV